VTEGVLSYESKTHPLRLDDEGPGFFDRQFNGSPTQPQIIFDVIVGVVMPIICLVFDPIVFRQGRYGSAIMAPYAALAYSAVALQGVGLIAWIATRACPTFFAGLLTVGFFIALGFAVPLVPISIMGLIVIIGVLGFTPWFTAFTFLRNANRALVASRSKSENGWLASLAGFVLALAIPCCVQLYVNIAVEDAVLQVMSGKPTDVVEGTRTLRQLSFMIDPKAITRRIDGDRLTQSHIDRLAQAYRDVTGRTYGEDSWDD